MRTQNRPHGNLILLPLLLTTTAYILASTGNYWCNFVWRTDTGGENTMRRGLGLWSFLGNDGYCYLYPDSFVADSNLKAARAFNILTTSIGFLCMLMMLCSACTPFSRGSWGCTGIYLILCSLFVGLTLLIKKSNLCTAQLDYKRGDEVYTFDGACTLGYGSNCAIAAIVFFFFAGVSVLKVPPPEVLIAEPTRVKETVVTTEEVKPDGTKVTTTKKEYENV